MPSLIQAEDVSAHTSSGILKRLLRFRQAGAQYQCVIDKCHVLVTKGFKLHVKNPVANYTALNWGCSEFE